MPKPSAMLSATQKDGKPLIAAEIYEATFRAWSSRSMTSSWGVAPPYSPAQFSLTIW